MNIIKFKDMLLDSSCGLSLDKIEMFNNELKGKYAYVINWMHIMPLDKITQEELYEIIKLIHNRESSQYIMNKYKKRVLFCSNLTKISV